MKRSLGTQPTALIDVVTGTQRKWLPGYSNAQWFDWTTSPRMTIDLTRDEIWFLKALRAAGERGRIVSAAASMSGSFAWLKRNT